MRLLLLLLAVTAVSPANLLHAQRGVARLPITSPSLAFAFHGPSAPSASPSVNGSASYWAEGGGIGAAALGALGIVLAVGLCSDSESANTSCFGPVIGTGLLGAGVGFTVGALVGARFPKH